MTKTIYKKIWLLTHLKDLKIVEYYYSDGSWGLVEVEDDEGQRMVEEFNHGKTVWQRDNVIIEFEKSDRSTYNTKIETV